MAKCTRCCRKGLFLKLTDGLCANCASTAMMEREQQALTQYISELMEQLSDQQALYDQIEAAAKASALEKLRTEAADLTKKVNILAESCEKETAKLNNLLSEQEKSEKAAASAVRKAQKGRELAKAIENACDKFDTSDRLVGIDCILLDIENYLKPTVSLTLQCLDMRQLRKRYKENEKNIQETFEKYKSRYTTKANITIYRLMVIALSAELQNILYSLSYGKLDDALISVRAVTDKYYAIAADGNQSIAPTLKKFVGELDYFFQEAVKIEYEYYVQKERSKEEQRAIREQMRQEAEERKELERQQKQVEKEEYKFQEQIAQATEKLQTADADMAAKLHARIAELQQQLSDVSIRKERIIHLQNGKAGNVYVISNLGAFGSDVFKIGMTRRSEPMERIIELGDASVPFPFDVHSMIFSDDASALETELHHILNDKRLNKVNLRKEFFKVDLDELEALVGSICPTAEFKRTMLAEQYRQSLSIDQVAENPMGEDLVDEDWE